MFRLRLAFTGALRAYRRHPAAMIADAVIVIGLVVWII